MTEIRNNTAEEITIMIKERHKFYTADEGSTAVFILIHEMCEALRF